ncbi:MAG: chemotaxis protein CheW [Syntrophothermus sp.]
MGEKHAQEELQMVAFKLGDEEYAVTIDHVHEIKNVTEITRVPRAPFYIKGVFNLRGKIIPVVDLKKRLSLGDTEVQNDSRIIVVEVEDHVVGLLVDSVTETTKVKRAEVDSPNVAVAGIAQEFIQGIAKIGERLLILLALNQITAEGQVRG